MISSSVPGIKVMHNFFVLLSKAFGIISEVEEDMEEYDEETLVSDSITMHMKDEVGKQVPKI